MTTRAPTNAGPQGAVELPRIELARSRARAQHVLFGDEAKVRVGRYELGERIGAGGMGLVYRAFDPELKRSVALKVLRRHDAQEGERLRGEATMLASLPDPDVVQVFDVWSRDGVPFVAMELAEGVTLREWLDERQRRGPEIIRVFLAVARVLARVHDAGVVHRDFKPENVIVQPDSPGARTRLLDFGVAVKWGAAAGIAGTPGFMAPEVVAGAAAHPSGDQFAFCVSLSEALEGVETSGRLQRALRRGRSQRASQRWPNLSPLIAALEGELTAGRRRVIGLAGLGLGCAIAAVLLARPLGSPPCTFDETVRGLQRDIDARGDLTPTVRSALEADLGAWRDSAAQACASGQQSSLACLQRQAMGLASLLRSQTHAASDWMLAISSLPSPSSCVLEAPSTSRRQEVGLARAEAALAVGDLDAASALADAALEASEGDAWTNGMARWILAEIAMRRGRFASAREQYEDAAFFAARAGDDRMVVLASCALVRVAEVLGLGPSASAAWVRQARVALERRPSPELEMRVAIASGWHALSLGDFDQARVEFDSGLEIAKEAEGPAATSLFTLHYELGCALVERRHFEAAIVHFEAARAGWSDAFGAAAPILGLAWKGIGDVARGRGQHADAIEAYERGRGLLADAQGPDSLHAATLEVSMADALYRQGRDDEAKRAYGRAQAILLGLSGDHRFLAAVEIGLGNLARDAGDWKAAYDSFVRARDISIEREGSQSMTAAIAESSAAEAAMNLGRNEDARALLRASIATRVALSGPDALSLAFPLTTLGRLQRADGELELARTTLQQAHALRRDADELDPRLLAETDFALAKVHAELGDVPAARQHARAARAGFDGPWEHSAADVQMVQRWLDALGVSSADRPRDP